MKFFWLFLMYTFLTCVWGGLLVLGRFLHCASSTAACPAPSAVGALGIVQCAIIAVLFGLFTGCLMGDQLNIALTNQTQVDRVKGIDHDAHLNPELDGRLQVWHNLAEVFGGDPAREGFRLAWLVPTAIHYKDPERLTGYCFRDLPKPRTQAEMEMV